MRPCAERWGAFGPRVGRRGGPGSVRRTGLARVPRYPPSARAGRPTAADGAVLADYIR